MVIWQILCIIGISFLILEIFTPSMFFLNFALAAFLTALASYWVANLFTLVIIFFVLSFLSFIFLRPVILKRFSKETNTGMEDKYIGKIVKVEEEITENKGVLSIYGERWEARTENGEIIPQGADAKILRNDSLIMIVTQNNY